MKIVAVCDSLLEHFQYENAEPMGSSNTAWTGFITFHVAKIQVCTSITPATPRNKFRLLRPLIRPATAALSKILTIPAEIMLESPLHLF
jgi:hypothetical protein